VSVAGDGIQVLDMKGQKLKTLPVDVTRETFMTGDTDKLYYTHYTTHTVHCTTFDQEQVYKFNHDELNFPQALSVDFPVQNDTGLYMKFIYALEQIICLHILI
jgi:hypothetical protein